ncbi:thymine dioxygenase [Rhodotorula toruloides]
MAVSGIVPIIDFAPFLTGSQAEKKEVAEELFKACTDVGFLMLRNIDSLIPPSQVSSAFAQTKQFFDLPMEVKEKLAWECPESNRGYVAEGRERVTQESSKEAIEKLRAQAPDYKETMEIGKDYKDGPYDSPFENRWPETDLPDFKPFMNQFFEDCHRLHVEIMRALALAMGLGEGFFDDKVNQKAHNLRLLNYPSIEKAKIEGGGNRAGSHSDYGTVTLLFQDSVGGLEVQDKQGNFVPARPVDDTVVVNVGDLLMRWSNDVLKSTIHRVVLPADGDPSEPMTARRNSIAFFSNPNLHEMIRCLPGTGEPKYPEVETEAYLVKRLGETCFHLVRRGLKGDCMAAYIANKYSKYCKQQCPLNQTPQFGCICRAGKVTNVDKTKCLTVCSGGSYPVGDGTCANASGYLSAGQCVTAALCPTGTWADKTGKTCSPCADTDAKSCSNGSVGTALSCNTTYLFNGTCIAGANLPACYYGDDTTHTAKACNTGVATCTGIGAGNALSCGTFADSVAKACSPCADPDASSCTDGKVGSAFGCKTLYLSLGTCVAAADIPDGYYPDDTTRTTKPCDTGVTKCTGAGDGNPLACGSDAAGAPYFLTPDGSCLTECDWGTGGSVPSHTCVACDSAAGILNCDAQGAKQCGYNSAGDLTYLTPTHNCELPNVDFPGYYPDDTTATFEPCNDGIETCLGLWEDQALSCGTRKDGARLFFIASSDASEDASLGYCIVAADCPDGTTADLVARSKGEMERSARRTSEHVCGCGVCRAPRVAGWPASKLAVAHVFSKYPKQRV